MVLEIARRVDVGEVLPPVELGVEPAAQRAGVGRRLMAAAAAAARDWPADTIRLDAYDAPAGAAPFYVRCGCREVGRVSYRGVPLVYLELPVLAAMLPP